MRHKDYDTVIAFHFHQQTEIIQDLHQQKKRINNEALKLNCTKEQINVRDTNRTFHPMAAEYAFFSSVHGTCPRREHVLSHKISHNRR